MSDPDLADYVMQKDRYAVYFLKDSDTILSLEKLG
jgi:hypothetical protein